MIGGDDLMSQFTVAVVATAVTLSRHCDAVIIHGGGVGHNIVMCIMIFGLTMVVNF